MWTARLRELGCIAFILNSALVFTVTACSGGGGTNAPTLSSVAVSPSAPSTKAGFTQQLTATGTYSDGSTKDLTNTVTWSSGSQSVATVSSSGLVTAVAIGTAVITATSGSVNGSVTVTVTPPALMSIAVSPAPATVKIGASLQLTATGTYSDGSTKDLTNTVTWSSGNQGVATVSISGVVTGVGQGPAVITATSGLVSGSVTVTVPLLTSIAISPAPATVTISASIQFTATGTFSDSSTQDLTTQVSWTAVNPVIASINPSGYASSLQAGYTTVTATSGSISSSTALTVLAAPRYLYVDSDAGRDLTRMAVDSVSGRPRYTGFLPTFTTNNIGPNCITIDPSGTHAYLTSQIIASGGSGYTGLVSIFAVDPITGALTATANNPHQFSIALGCLKFSTNGEFAYASSGIENAGNQLATFKVNSDATLTLNNTVSYPYFPTDVAIDPLGDFLYVDVNDVLSGLSSSSSLYAYSIDPSSGSLTALTNSPFTLPPGTYGYLSFHPSGNFIYVSDENRNTVTEYSVERQSGNVTAVASSAVTPCTNPLAVQFSPDGARAYASCLSPNPPVVVYAVASSGSLTATGSVSINTLPEQMLVDPSGEFLYIAGFDNSLRVFSLSSNGGIAASTSVAGRFEPYSIALVGGASPVTWTTTSAFVGTSGDNKVTPYIVNSDGTLTAGNSIATGTGPFTATNLPWGSDLLVAGQGTAPNLDAYQVIGNLLFALNPFGSFNSVGGLVIEPTGLYVYVSDPAAGQVIEYAKNGATWYLYNVFSAGTGAGPLAMDPAGYYLFVGNQTAKSISLIVPSGAAPVPDTTLSYTPLAMAVESTGNLLFVSGDDGSLHMFSDAGGKLTSKANAVLLGNSSSIAIDPVANFVYAAGAAGLEGFRYDLSAQTFTQVNLSVPVSLSGATGVYIDPSGEYLYVSVSSGTTNSLYLFTINSDGTLTSSPANPVATPNHSASMDFSAQVQ